MITRDLVEREMESTLDSNQINRAMSHQDFSATLQQLNDDHPFDINLVDQLFQKMQNESRKNQPTMRVFPTVYVEAFDSLDKKIDIQNEHILVLNQKIDNNEEQIQSLQYQLQMNNLPSKRQVLVPLF